ncbi:APC family permease [Sphingosinicella sp. CPCC 101087]|uniref:APC family permease n=1 Tax=Sphingosinicella sp. CPCC 101087 TaxID=2497754 RepID=UPI00101CA143|nr:amino acid permease [Sphingosinicella sp. CPCC 101087]
MDATTTGVTPTTPRRAFGFWICLALVVGNMIGSGFFLLPATLAPFGWNGVAGWIVTTSGALCLAAVFGSLARAFPEAGGPYAYSRRAFGPFPAFVVAWAYWVSMWVGNVAIATGVIAPLSTVFPGMAPHSVWLTLALIWSLTAINCIGARPVGVIQLVTTLLKFLPLVAVVVVAALVLGEGGAAAAPPLRAEALQLGGETGIAAAAALTLWSFLGLESATVPAERVRNPSRNIARATLIGVAVTGAFYTFAASAVALLLPLEQVARSGAPMADFIGLHWGGPAGIVIALFAAIAAFGALNGWILMQGELPWAMARDGVFPSWLAKLSRRGTPARAHVAASLLVTIVLSFNYSRSMTDLFGFLILLATSAALVVYLACSVAAIRLGTSRRLVPAFLGAALFSLWAIWGAGGEAMLWGAVLLVSGVPLYFLTRRRDGSSPQAAADPGAPAE